MFTLSLSHTHPQEKTTLSPAPSLSYFSPANLWTQGFHTNTSFCLSPTNHQDMHDSKTIFQTNKEARPREESEGRELKTVGWLPPLVRLRLAVSSSLPVAVAVSVCVRLRLTTYGQSGTLCQHCQHSIVGVHSSAIVTAVNCHCALGVLYCSEVITWHGLWHFHPLFHLFLCVLFLFLSPLSHFLSLSLSPSLSFGSQLQVFKFCVSFSL